MEFQKKVSQILKQSFPAPDKVMLRDEDGILGVVISKKFKGVDSLERMNMIWNALDEKLSAEERDRVVSILAVAPEEKSNLDLVRNGNGRYYRKTI